MHRGGTVAHPQRIVLFRGNAYKRQPRSLVRRSSDHANAMPQRAFAGEIACNECPAHDGYLLRLKVIPRAKPAPVNDWNLKRAKVSRAYRQPQRTGRIAASLWAFLN